MTKMTPVQADLARDNHGLIYFTLRKYGFNIDEHYGTAAVGLCKAARAYDTTKGSTFANFAVLVITNELRHDRRRQRAARRTATVISFSTPQHDDSITVGDSLAAPYDVFDDIAAKDAYEQSMRGLKPKHQAVVHYRIAGYGQLDIARMTGLSQSYVRRILTNFGNCIKEGGIA